MTSDPTIVTELDELLTAIRGYDDPRRAGDEWRKAFRTLQKSDLPPGRVRGVVGMRDVDQLAKLIEQLRTPETAPPPADDAPSSEICKRALRAFRKRLKLTRLDEESKLGRGPLSKGGGSSSAAITPPVEWPDDVWQELVRQGKLRYIGRRFYELAKP
jgi:hypothetical protein